MIRSATRGLARWEAREPGDAGFSWLVGAVSAFAVTRLDHHDAVLDGPAARADARNGVLRAGRVDRLADRDEEACAFQSAPGVVDRRAVPDVGDVDQVAGRQLAVVRFLELLVRFALHIVGDRVLNGRVHDGVLLVV